MHCDITLQFFNCVCLFLQQGEKTLTIKFVPQIPSTIEMVCRLNGSSAALFAKNVSGGIECTIPFATGGRGTSMATLSCNVFNTTGGREHCYFSSSLYSAKSQTNCMHTAWYSGINIFRMCDIMLIKCKSFPIHYTPRKQSCRGIY